MKKLRVSYSLLYLWNRGDIDGAVSTYFRTPRDVSDQIQQGKDIHEEIAKHIEVYNTFPDWFFKHELKLPETEKKIIVPYNEMFDLSAVFDCYDSLQTLLFEYKTGVSDSLEWTRTFQLPFYFLVGELSSTPIERAFLIRWNQYKKERDYTLVWNSQKLRDNARNFVDSYAPEIYKFFEHEGLL